MERLKDRFSILKFGALTKASTKALGFILGGFAIASCNSSGGQGGGSTNALGDPVGSGYAVYSTATEVRIVTLATGISRLLDLNTTVWPSFDGREWLAIDTKNRYSTREDDLVSFDPSGTKQGQLRIRKSLHGIPKLSPDKQRIGVFWADEDYGESYTEPTFTVFDRRGNVVHRIPGVESFDWLFDGNSIYTTAAGEIFLADSSGRNRRLVKKMSGEIMDVAASRDGKQIAFSVLRPQDPQWRVWTMGIDGTNLRQLTTSRLNEMDPVWVGATGWLLVRQGVSVSISGYHGCPRLHLVNTLATGIVELQPEDSAFSKVVKYKDLNSGRDYFTSACPFSPAAWIQD